MRAVDVATQRLCPLSFNTPLEMPAPKPVFRITNISLYFQYSIGDVIKVLGSWDPRYTAFNFQYSIGDAGPRAGRAGMGNDVYFQYSIGDAVNYFMSVAWRYYSFQYSIGDAIALPLLLGLRR